MCGLQIARERERVAGPRELYEERERERERGAEEVCLIVGREFAKGEQGDASRGVAAASGQTVLEVATKRSSGQTSTTSWEFFV